MCLVGVWCGGLGEVLLHRRKFPTLIVELLVNGMVFS